jgi:hypothetical protein
MPTAITRVKQLSAALLHTRLLSAPVFTYFNCAGVVVYLQWILIDRLHPKGLPMLRHWRSVLLISLIGLGLYLWLSVTYNRVLRPGAFTQSCAAATCPDEAALFALMQDKFGLFRRIPQTTATAPSSCAPKGRVDVYRPLFTSDYQYAVMGIARGGNPGEAYVLLFEHTPEGWKESRRFGLSTITTDCYWTSDDTITHSVIS